MITKADKDTAAIHIICCTSQLRYASAAGLHQCAAVPRSSPQGHGRWRDRHNSANRKQLERGVSAVGMPAAATASSAFSCCSRGLTEAPAWPAGEPVAHLLLHLLTGTHGTQSKPARQSTPCVQRSSKNSRQTAQQAQYMMSFDGCVD